MTQAQQRNFIIGGATGALIAFVSLIVMALVCSMAVLGGLIAPFSYLYGHLAAFLWLIAWHSVSAIFLWTSREAQNV